MALASGDVAERARRRPNHAKPSVETPKTADPRHLASLGKRFGGAVIDGVFALVVGAPLSFAVAAVTGMERTLLFQQLCFMVPIAAQWALVARRGQSLGKILLRTRIVLADGRWPGFFNGVVLRAWPLMLLSFLPTLTSRQLKPFSTLMTLADVLVIFAAGHRCLHDRIAGTVVVDVR